MTRSLVRIPQSRRLLSRLLEQPGLVDVVQRLRPEVLGALIQHVGLEDSGEIVALATTEQLKQVFDDDLWSNEKPGTEERLDTGRFGVWLGILTELGADFAADKMAELDEDFFTAALSQLVWVLSLEDLTLQGSEPGRNRSRDDLTQKALEGSLNHELGEYFLISRDPLSWDAVLSVLVSLDENHHDFLRRVLARCCFLADELIEDQGGLFEVLTSEEQLQSDVAFEREQRKEAEGFVTPLQAAHFLELARREKLETILTQSAADPISRAHFRSFEKRDPEAEPAPGPDLPELKEGLKQVFTLLREEEVIPVSDSTETVLLPPSADGAAAGQEGELAGIRQALLALQSLDGAIHSRRMSELSYLSNVLIAGCGYRGRRFRPFEAARSALAVCNLGVELFTRDSPEKIEDLLIATELPRIFRAGWNFLHHQVQLPAARGLLEFLPKLETRGDVWLAGEVSRLARYLKVKLEAGMPWETRERLELLLATMEAAKVAGFQAILDECPGRPQAGERQGETLSSLAEAREALAWVRGFAG